VKLLRVAVRPVQALNKPFCRHVVSYSEVFAFILPVVLCRSCPALSADVCTFRIHSSSPTARRNLKPSPIATPVQHEPQHSSTTELPSAQPAGNVITAGKDSQSSAPAPLTPTANRKRKSVTLNQPQESMSSTTGGAEAQASSAAPQAADVDTSAQEPKPKKSRTNTPWTPAEELRLKQMRDTGNSWSEIAKVQIHHAWHGSCAVQTRENGANEPRYGRPSHNEPREV
jgi:hypothetical protein